LLFKLHQKAMGNVMGMRACMFECEMIRRKGFVDASCERKFELFSFFLGYGVCT
jgi:hypothetical protein